MALKCLHENNEIKGKLHRMSGVCTTAWNALLLAVSFNENANICQMTGQFNEVMKSLILCGGRLGEVLRRWVYYYPQPIHWTEAFDY